MTLISLSPPAGPQETRGRELRRTPCILFPCAVQPWAAWLASLGFRLLNCKISRDEDGTRRSTPGVRDGPWGSHTSPEPLSQLHGQENRASGRLLTTIITLIMATLCPRRQQREEPDAGQERPAKRERQDRKVKERPSYQTDKTLLKEPQLQLDPEHVPNTNLLGPKARMTPWSDGHVPTCFTPHSRWPLTPPSSHPRPRHLRTAGQGLKSRPP